AEDRCHRMGQKKEVYVTRLVSKDTVEVDIHGLARKKLQLEKAVTDGIKGQLEGINGMKEVLSYLTLIILLNHKMITNEHVKSRYIGLRTEILG
ncbi:hypothetical protein ANCDUO_19921, partial [Ancylostoma duodenale]